MGRKLAQNPAKILRYMQKVKEEKPILDYEIIAKNTKINYSNVNRYCKILEEEGFIIRFKEGYYSMCRLTELGETFDVEQDILTNGNMDAEILKLIIPLFAENKINLPEEIDNNPNYVKRLIELFKEIEK